MGEVLNNLLNPNIEYTQAEVYKISYKNNDKGNFSQFCWILHWNRVEPSMSWRWQDTEGEGYMGVLVVAVRNRYLEGQRDAQSTD